jgi:NAD-dependent deacetylase
MEARHAASDSEERIREAARLIRAARHLTAFTGAGISVESGVPPFRGPGGLWSKYDPRLLELPYFLKHPEVSWPVLKDIFYDHFGKARPNRAHEVLAAWETKGYPRGDGTVDRSYLKILITQNIDNLHFEAGSRNVVEFHGNSHTLVCLACGARHPADPAMLAVLPPRCSCGGMLKPDFVFFGENIPPAASTAAEEAARRTDCMLVVGSTGAVYPAALVPRRAKEHGATLIEINPEPSEFTADADVRIPLGAAEGLTLIEEELSK